MTGHLSYEDAVVSLEQTPAGRRVLCDSYLDPDTPAAARRFAESTEFRETLRLLSQVLPPRAWSVLDFGAGNGIASFAFALRGHHVVAVEPCASARVGREAARALLRSERIDDVELHASLEELPESSACLDLIYIRQVLHHCQDVPELGRRLPRLLGPGGVIFIATEHVAATARQRRNFLEAHPLHGLTGAEDARPRSAYLSSFLDAGMELVRVIDYQDLVLGPGAKRRSLRAESTRRLSRWVGGRIGAVLGATRPVWWLLTAARRFAARNEGYLLRKIAPR